MTERFELLSQLGKGGMGVVWKARDTETGETIAIKLLHAMFADDPDYVARFEREVEVAQRIDSPHVVKVLGFGRRSGVPYMAMEFIDGQSLKDMLRSRGRLTWDEAQNYIGQTLEGLAAAHAAGVLHRDIKPANLLVDAGGQVKVVDFGISRATDLTRLTGGMTMLGTPTYMAPEGQVDECSELYSVGVVLYELLTGEPPFVGDTMHSIIVKHMRDAPDLRRLPVEARKLVGYLLEKEPGDRPPSARSALLTLKRLPQRRSEPGNPDSHGHSERPDKNVEYMDGFGNMLEGFLRMRRPTAGDVVDMSSSEPERQAPIKVRPNTSPTSAEHVIPSRRAIGSVRFAQMCRLALTLCLGFSPVGAGVLFLLMKLSGLLPVETTWSSSESPDD